MFGGVLDRDPAWRAHVDSLRAQWREARADAYEAGRMGFECGDRTVFEAGTLGDVADGVADERVKPAILEVVRLYLPRSSTAARKRIMTALLLRAARSGDWLTALGTHAYFPDIANGRSWLRKDRWRSLERGALALADRGALCCLRCHRRLAEPFRVAEAGKHSRTVRRDYCGHCESRAMHDYERRRIDESIRFLLDVIGPAVAWTA